MELNLKDLHLPEPVGYWPPAPGWWLLLIGVPALIVALRWLYRRWHRPNPKREALQQLLAIKNDSQAYPLHKLIQLSELMRRSAISFAPRSHVAGLTGELWLDYLDATLTANAKTGEKHPFSLGAGRLLAYSHFQPHAPDAEDLAALFGLCERWLKQQRTL